MIPVRNGNNNRERRGVADADTTYVDPSAVGIHNKNCGLPVHIHSHMVYVMPCMCREIPC